MSGGYRLHFINAEVVAILRGLPHVRHLVVTGGIAIRLKLIVSSTQFSLDLIMSVRSQHHTCWHL